MSTVFFSITKSEEFVGATILIDGQPYPVSKDHPRYEEIEEILLYEENPDAENLIGLINPVKGVADSLTRLSERVTIGGNVLYFDGDALDGSLAEHIVRVFRDDSEERGKGYKNFVAFLEKLATNPSKVSQQHLFDFVQHHGLTITDEGDLLLYKSTNPDGTSTYAGYGIVTTPDGTVTKFEKQKLPNAVGNIVEIPRDMVDEDRNAACSTGLHVGAFSYASTYSRRLWNVVVNPRDVVSVPHDASSAKIRVARYTILSENSGKVEHKSHSIDLKTEAQPGVVVEVEEDEPEVEVTEALVGVVTPPAAAGGSRVAEYEQVIRDLLKADPKTNLSRYKNKRVTKGRRDEFVQAATNLGFKA